MSARGGGLGRGGWGGRRGRGCRARTAARGVRAILSALIVATVVVGVVAPRPALGDGGAAWRYRPPVVAAVADPFRPPPQPWLAGNRGIEYATVPGTVVR